MQEHDAYSTRLMDVSDQIAEVNRRILNRAKKGEPRDESDDRLLSQLMAELNRPRTAAAESY